MAAKKPPTIPLPKSWTKHVRTPMLHVISLAQYATAYTRSWAADSTIATRGSTTNGRVMPEGTIRKLTDRGFGFIALPGGKDIFFHSSNLGGVEYEDLHEGQKVSFVEGRGPKGPRPEQVRPV